MQENEQSMTSSSESDANVQEFSDENSDLDNVGVSGGINHSVVFKCIGATKESRMQGVLASALQKIALNSKTSGNGLATFFCKAL